MGCVGKTYPMGRSLQPVPQTCRGQRHGPPTPQSADSAWFVDHKTYMQPGRQGDSRSYIGEHYFLGYPSFASEAPFDASLFVEFRKRLGMDTLNAINEKIASLKTRLETEGKGATPTTGPKPPPDQDGNRAGPLMEQQPGADEKRVAPMPELEPLPDHNSNATVSKNKGRIIFDATACPQDGLC